MWQQPAAWRCASGGAYRQAAHLELAYTIRWTGKSTARGTLRSGVEMLGGGLLVRQAGEVAQAPRPGRRRTVDFGKRAGGGGVCSPGGTFSQPVSAPGVPSQRRSYARLPEQIAWLLPAGHRVIERCFSQVTVKRLLRGCIDRLPPGPTAEQRSHTHTYLWGRVSDGNRQTKMARMQGPEPPATAGQSISPCRPCVKFWLAQRLPDTRPRPAHSERISSWRCGGTRQDDDRSDSKINAAETQSWRKSFVVYPDTISIESRLSRFQGKLRGVSGGRRPPRTRPRDPTNCVAPIK